jgi:hypothetical protein
MTAVVVAVVVVVVIMLFRGVVDVDDEGIDGDVGALLMVSNDCAPSNVPCKMNGNRNE